MSNTISISIDSPRELEIIVKQLLQGPDPYKASEAVYAPDIKEGPSGKFPLIFDGTIKGIPCTVRISETDFGTVANIVTAFGFKADDLVVREGDDRSAQFLRKK